MNSDSDNYTGNHQLHDTASVKKPQSLEDKSSRNPIVETMVKLTRAGISPVATGCGAVV